MYTIEELTLVVWFETMSMPRTRNNIIRICNQVRECAEIYPRIFADKITAAERMREAFVKAELHVV